VEAIFRWRICVSMLVIARVKISTAGPAAKFILLLNTAVSIMPVMLFLRKEA
jgi:hypothetical protein